MKSQKDFDPDNNFQLGQGIFGLPYNNPNDADLILLAVPWEVTVSYGSGTALAPEAIYAASSQIDLEDEFASGAWKAGIFCEKPSVFIEKLCIKQRKRAAEVINFLEKHGNVELSPSIEKSRKSVNNACEFLHKLVEHECNAFLKKGKLIGLIGGDHSSSLGLIRALSSIHTDFGILQIDAHADLRNAYEGFIYSHASAMQNALQLNSISKLVQVGVRDYCRAEKEYIFAHTERVKCHFQHRISDALFNGESWDSICNRIINDLPQNVYISFDIDGLDPVLCPQTGTPVPGGLSYNQAIYLIKKIVRSKRKIIGFDLCEVSPGQGKGDSWDAIVGARILYQLCINSLKSCENI